MKVTTEALERCEILMTIEAEPAQEQDLLKKAARRIARQVQIPGFRPGKAPYNTVVRRFGLETIQQEVLEHSGEKVISDALKEAELEPQAPLSFDEVTWDPFTIKVRVPGPPVVELGDYRDVRLKTKAIKVTAKDVKEELEALQERNATWVPVERDSKLGDLLTMSVVEKDGEEVLAENEAVEYELVDPAEIDEAEKDDGGEDQERPDFTTPLLGLNAGDSKIFSINYPEDWGAEKYAGKEITFEVEVSSVKEKELDPLDDDFAQSVGDVETLAELKDKIRTSIQQRREQEYNKELGQKVLDKIMEDAETIEWPVALEDYRIDQELERLQERLGQANLTLETFLNMQKKTEEELREEIREQAFDDIKTGIVLEKLAQLEMLEVSQMEVLERARAIAQLSGAGDQFWQSVLASQSYRANIANGVLTDKVFERLAAIAKGEAPEPGAEPEVDESADEEDQAEKENNEAEAAADEPQDDTVDETVEDVA